MILTTQELQRMKRKTQYDNIYRYEAPDGYEFWSNGTNFGTVVYGGDCLENHYYLKEIK